MKVCIIVHDVYQKDNDFPLAEAYLGAVLREDGHYVDILCMDVFHYSLEYLSKYLIKNNFNYICVGFMSARFKETIIPLCQVINKNKGRGKLILGGHGASAVPEYTLDKTQADAIIIGEAEKTLVKLVNNGINEQIVKGVPYKNLDDIPLPAWDLFPMDKYISCKNYSGQSKNEYSINIITSRGCVNRCSFCYRMEKGIRLRSIDNIISEIKILYNKYNVKYFVFADECFILNKKRLEDFYQTLQDNKLDINYWCTTRVIGVNDEILELLKASGCKFISYGFESMNKNVLNEMNKNTTPEDNKKTAELTMKHGIPFRVNMIWGYPNDSKNTLYEDMDFILRYDTPDDCRTIRPVTPYPGCELYYELIDKGLLLGIEDFFNKFKNSDLITINLTKYPDKLCYEWLLEVNSRLIMEHYKNNNKDIEEGKMLISNLKNLYEGIDIKFRGVRHYDK